MTDAVTTADLQALADQPGTVLVGQLINGGPSWTVRVTTPADITADECPIYSTSWGEADADGLSAQVRTYLTTGEINRWLANDYDWDHCAEIATNVTEAAMARWRRGDDELAAEVIGDPTAWAKYVA
jgi:hypothetical protein